MSTPTSPDPRERPGTEPVLGPDSAVPTSGDPAVSPERTTPLGAQHAESRPVPPPVPRADEHTAVLPASGSTAGPPPSSAVPPPPPAAPAAAPNPSASAADATTPLPTSSQPATPPAESRRTLREDPGAAEDRRITEERRLSEDRRLEAERRDLPEPPRKPGFGRHLLGLLLGLVLTPVALLLVGIGTSRLSDVASGDATTDALGLTLLVLGAVLLAVIVLLGAWSPAVPITGGLVWGVALGLAYLVVPDVMSDAVDQMLGDRVLPAAVEQLTDSAMSGQLLVTGTLLMAAGIATAVARRIGRRWAERRVAAEQARADVERAAAARTLEADRGAGHQG